MNLLNKAIKIYKKEGFTTLFEKAIGYAVDAISPKPPVTNGSPPFIIWYLKYIYNFIFEVKYGSGVDVMSEDWDTLILLDACRFDDFKEINDIEGKLNFKISRSVDSPGFIKENFVGRDLSDTVYVTANPHVRLVGKNTFHDIITDPIEDWDSEIGCVRPNAVTEAAIEAHQKYPKKRIIVHYMQPHDPPIGATACELREKTQIGSHLSNNQSDGDRLMELVADGEISEKIAHQAYRETLKIVLEEVNRLLDQINGKVIITSDHGEMFGESPYPLLGNLYEHYRNPKSIELCKVPWLIIDSGQSRRSIIEDENTTSVEVSKSNIEDQLEALGYK